MLSGKLSVLKELLTHRVTADVSILSAGRFISAVLGFLIGTIIARKLGPAEFGLFSIAMAVFGIAVVIAEMGLGTSLVRYIPLYSAQDENKAAFYLQTGFWSIFSISVLVSIVGLFLARPIAVFIYNKPQLVMPLRLGFLGVVGGILWSFLLASLHAKELFKKYSLITIVINVLKLGAIGALVLLYRLSITNVLLVQVFIPVLGFIIGLWLAPIKLVGLKGDTKSAVGELFGFGKWIFLVDVVFMLSSRVDLLLLGRFVEDDLVGFFSVAYSLIYMFTILTSSVNNVLLPKVAKMTTLVEIKEYIGKVLKATFIGAVFLLPGFYIVGPVVKLFYGDAYLYSITIFQVMLIGYLFSFIVDPVNLVVYAINRPQLLAVIATVKLVVSLVANLILIPMFGVMGAAVASIVTNVLSGCIALGLIYSQLNKRSVLEKL